MTALKLLDALVETQVISTVVEGKSMCYTSLHRDITDRIGSSNADIFRNDFITPTMLLDYSFNGSDIPRVTFGQAVGGLYQLNNTAEDKKLALDLYDYMIANEIDKILPLK